MQVAAAFCLFVLTAALSAADTLRVRADFWMPFNGKPNEGEPGYVIEILRRVFEPAGIQVDYQTMPWGDALEAVAKGEIDAVIGANRSEAKGLVLPTEAIGAARVGLFVRKDQPWAYGNIGSLLKARMGVIVDYKYWDALDGYIQSHNAPLVTRFAGDAPLADAISKLVDGTIDVVPETLPVFMWTVRSTGGSAADFKISYLHEGDDIFVAFQPTTEAGQRHADLLSAGIAKLRASGELAAILSRYGQKDWKTP